MQLLWPVALPTPKPTVPFKQGRQAVLLRPTEKVFAGHAPQPKLDACEQYDVMKLPATHAVVEHAVQDQPATPESNQK